MKACYHENGSRLCAFAHNFFFGYDKLSEMLKQSQKDDLVTSVYIEMNRVFAVVANRLTPEEANYLGEIEAAIKSVTLAFGNLPDEAAAI